MNDYPFLTKDFYSKMYNQSSQNAGQQFNALNSISNGVNESNYFNTDGQFIGNSQGLQTPTTTTPTGVFGTNMSGTDMFGIGLAGVNMGLDFMNNKEQLKIQQGNLDLSKDKFAWLQQNQTDTRAATQANLAADRVNS